MLTGLVRFLGVATLICLISFTLGAVMALLEPQEN